MPLIFKKPFEPLPHPEGLNEDDQVFYCEETNEIFVDHDDYYHRQLLLVSTVWSCEFTGKANLTFDEALESEQEAMKAIDDFPKYLEIPILYIVHNHSCRGRFDELLNDIVAVMKDRFFIGEECTLTENGKRKLAKVLSCKVHKTDDEEKPSDASSLPSSSSYVYDVQILDGLQPDDDGHREGISGASLSRGKQVASRTKLKLFLKNSCYMDINTYKVKGRFLNDGVISQLDWDLILGGPEPCFPKTPMARGRPSKVNLNDVSFDDVDPELSTLTTPESGKAKRKSEKGRLMSEKKRQRILSQQEELATMFETAKKLNVDVDEYEQTEKFLSVAEIATLKEAIKLARSKDREAQKELKKQKLKAKNEWGRKRDDLECDDLKPLPKFTELPLPEWLSDEELGDYLMVLQFFTSYSDLLPIKEIRGTSRVTLSDVIMAIRCPDPQRSPYADLMRVILSARTERADEEDGDEADFRNKEEVTLIQLQNCDPSHPVFGDDIREASALHKSIRMTHGESLRHLPVDWMTLTEVLRMALNTSGYYTGQNTHRHRLFARGNYHGFEDPGFVMAKENPELMEKLKKGTVFDLTPNDRFILMDVFIRQLLSYSKFRMVHEEKLNSLWEQKRELRKLKNWDEQQEKEAKESRLVQEYEIEKLEEQGIKTKPAPPQASDETKQLRELLRTYKHSSTRKGHNDLLEQVLLSGVAYNELVIDDVVLARDLQKQYMIEAEHVLKISIFDMTTSFGPLHLGRDRAFRSYFLIESLPALLVENPTEKDRIGVCGEPTPNNDSSADSINLHFGCSGDMETCVVHGKCVAKKRWQYVDNIEIIDQILAACNPRGLREIELSEEIVYHRHRIEEIIQKVKSKNDHGHFAPLFLHGQDDPSTMPQTLEWEIEMRELLLELEEKLEQGQLGRLPESIDREKWRYQLLETGDVSDLVSEPILVSGTEDEVLWTVEDMQSLDSAQKLALAFLQLTKSINLKFLKPPFILVKLDEAGKPCVSQVYQNWQRSLTQCASVPAVALFLSTFEPCILWDKSRLQGKCRMCRRKGTAESLILCADCDKCFHLGCVHLKEVKPDWICSDCNATKRKLAAAEKRKAAKEVKIDTETLQNGEYNDDADENSLMDDSMDSTSSEVVRTSSGRAVKRVSTYRDTPVASTPPLKNSRRQSSRTNGTQSQSDDDDYDSDNSTRKSVKRRRTGPKEELTTPRASGLRDNDPQLKEKMSKLEKAVRDAMKLEYAWPFLEPVSEKDVPDYYQIIKKPIDLRTMINKMKNMEYDAPEGVKADMKLLVANCKQYNEDGSEIFECAEQIDQFFDDRLKEVFENKKRRR